MRQWKPKMVEAGFQELVFEDAMEVIVDQLNALGTQDPLTVMSLESNMRDGMLSNMVIMYMRMLTSCEVQRRQDFFAPFILVRAWGYGLAATYTVQQDLLLCGSTILVAMVPTNMRQAHMCFLRGRVVQQ